MEQADNRGWQSVEPGACVCVCVGGVIQRTPRFTLKFRPAKSPLYLYF